MRGKPPPILSLSEAVYPFQPQRGTSTPGNIHPQRGRAELGEPPEASFTPGPFHFNQKAKSQVDKPRCPMLGLGSTESLAKDHRRKACIRPLRDKVCAPVPVLHAAEHNMNT